MLRTWLKDIRTSKEFTQGQVAEATGMTRAYYTRIENGTRGHSLPVETAKKIATALCFDWRLFYPDDETEEITRS